MPYQSGRTHLEALPDMNGVFCKYIKIDSKRFLPTTLSSLKVLLTVSWNKKSFDTPNDASASWSEDLTSKGFKACALVAGRKMNSQFNSFPVIHWTVFQEQVFKNQMRGGSEKFKTWYTGTQCQTIVPGIYIRDFYSQKPTVIASVYHSKPKNYQNAMTVWAELQPVSYRQFAVRVCARELQNFDGKHEGIEVVSLTFTVTRIFHNWL